MDFFISSFFAMIIAFISGQPYYLQPVNYTEDETYITTRKEYHSFIDDLSKLPISFRYGLKKYSGLGGFKEISRKTVADDKKENTKIVLTKGDSNIALGPPKDRRATKYL